jgi:hypothetical protein
MLAHSSGEWIASDWPVCAIADTATPRRMGAALTYARRYALFTLVGIAGEDDLDAPDLVTPQKTPSSDVPRPNDRRRPNGGQHNQALQDFKRRGLVVNLRHVAEVLAPDASAELRDRLLGELNELGSGDQATVWARRSFPETKKLTEADARLIGESFRAKLLSFAIHRSKGSFVTDDVAVTSDDADDKVAKRRTAPTRIDKSALAIPTPRRIRDRNHVRHVAVQSCLICGRRPCDPHHLRFAQSRALGRKVSDEFTVPLCRGHHREVHNQGDELAWWNNAGIDPSAAARALWLDTHPRAAGGAKPPDASVPILAERKPGEVVGTPMQEVGTNSSTRPGTKQPDQPPRA